MPNFIFELRLPQLSIEEARARAREITAANDRLPRQESSPALDAQQSPLLNIGAGLRPRRMPSVTIDSVSESGWTQFAPLLGGGSRPFAVPSDPPTGVEERPLQSLRSGLFRPNYGGRRTRASLNREGIDDQPLTGFIKDETEDARNLPTEDAVLQKIGGLVSELHSRWNCTKLDGNDVDTELLDGELVYTETRRLFEAAVDEALARSGSAAAEKIVNNISEMLRAVPFVKVLDETARDNMQQKIKEYLESRPFRPSV